MSVPALERMQQSSAYSRQAINKILETLDNDIRDLARRKVPRSIIPPQILDIEVDELAQLIRLKLWSALQKVHIVNPKAYTIHIAHTVAIGMARKYRKSSSTVFIDDYCEQGEIMTALGYGMQDPAIEYEQHESLATKTEALVNGIRKLPPQQRYAMLCDLKDCAANIPLLMLALIKYDLGLELIHWPTEEGELKSIRTSHSIARSKLKVRLKREDLYRNRPVRIRQNLHSCG